MKYLSKVTLKLDDHITIIKSALDNKHNISNFENLNPLSNF